MAAIHGKKNLIAIIFNCADFHLHFCTGLHIRIHSNLRDTVRILWTQSIHSMLRRPQHHGSLRKLWDWWSK